MVVIKKILWTNCLFLGLRQKGMRDGDTEHTQLPGYCASPSLAAGNTQNLECCSHFRTSLPPPQHHVAKAPHKPSAGIQCTSPKTRFQTCSCTVIPLSPVFLSMLISGHCPVLPVSPADCKYQCCCPATAASDSSTWHTVTELPWLHFPRDKYSCHGPHCSVTALITVSLPQGPALSTSIYVFWDMNTIRALLLSYSLTFVTPIHTQYTGKGGCTALTLFSLTYAPRFFNKAVWLKKIEIFPYVQIILRAAFLLAATESLEKVYPPLSKRKGMFKEQTEYSPEAPA